MRAVVARSASFCRESSSVLCPRPMSSVCMNEYYVCLLSAYRRFRDWPIPTDDVNEFAEVLLLAMGCSVFL
jgi:hypothetical protein